MVITHRRSNGILDEFGKMILQHGVSMLQYPYLRTQLRHLGRHLTNYEHEGLPWQDLQGSKRILFYIVLVVKIKRQCGIDFHSR